MSKKVFECVVNVKVMPSIQLYVSSTMSMSIVHSNNLLQAVICKLAPLPTWLERSAGELGVKVSNPCQLYIFPQIVSHVNVNHLTSRCTDGGRTQVLGTIYDLICLEPFH